MTARRLHQNMQASHFCSVLTVGRAKKQERAWVLFVFLYKYTLPLRRNVRKVYKQKLF